MSEIEGIETLIYEPNLDEFEDLDDDCSGSPNHLGCIRATSFHIGQPKNGLKVDPVNRSIGVSQFEVVHCYKRRIPLYIFLMSLYARVSKSANAFARHGHDLHKETSKHIQATHA